MNRTAWLFVLLMLTAIMSYSQPPKTMRQIALYDRDVVASGNGAANPNARALLLGDGQHYRIELFQGQCPRLITICNGNNIWTWADSIGRWQHDTTDSSPTSFHVFGQPEAKEVRELLLGQEVTYFAMRGRQLADEKLDSFYCSVWTVDTAKTTLKLWVNKKAQTPVQIHIVSPYSDYSVRYIVYSDVPYDSAAFLPVSQRGRRPAEAATQDSGR